MQTTFVFLYGNAFRREKANKRLYLR